MEPAALIREYLVLGLRFDRVEPGVSLPVAVDVALADVDVEVVVYLVDEADLLSGELASRAHQSSQVGPQIVGARLVKPLVARNFWQRCEQTLGLAG